MNYLIFIPSWSYRGGERIFISLAKKLKDEGNGVIVVCGRKDEKDATGSKGIKIVYSKLFNKILQNNLIFFIFSWAVMFFVALNQKQKTDCVITESNQCLWSATLYSYFKKSKLIWYVMAYELVHFKNKPYNFLYESSFGLVERRCANRVNEFYALAPRIKRILDKKFKINSKVVLPVIIKSNLTYQKMFFLPATFHWKKNQQLAIRLLTRFKDAYLVLAGKGEDENKLRELSKKLKVENRVYFAGVLNQDEIGFFYKKADLTLICSLNDNEGLSLTALESLSYGTPVLVSDRAGVAEIIEGWNHVYIAQPTLKDFSCELKKIYNDLSNRK